MNIDKNKSAILYVIENSINNLKYYGIIHKEGKTILERLDDHINGRRAGKFIHKAIKELGAENFSIREVERGTFEYISLREIEEAKKCLYVKGDGYNGNAGKCIILDSTMQEKRLSNIDQKKKTQKWRETYNSRREFHNYKRNEDTLQKQEEKNYSKIRGKNKYTLERLRKQSESLKKRWESPSDSMLNGIEKMRNTMTGQTKETSTRIQKFVKTIKEKNRTGKNSPRFKGYWITPLGRYEIAENAAKDIGITLSTLRVWCLKNKKIYKNYYIENPKILNEWNEKMTKDIGFCFDSIK